MRKQYFGLLFAILLLLSSCDAEKSIAYPSPSKEIPSLYVIAELPADRSVPSTEKFEVRIGYGQMTKIYKYATMEIEAIDFEITDSQGNVYKDTYVYTISGFNDDKFHIDFPHNHTDIRHYETFTFRYIGNKSETSGSISVWLTTLQNGEPSTPEEQNHGQQGTLVSFYYKTNNQKIVL